MSEEQWRPIPGYEGRYDVSDQGRVRSSLRRGRIRKLHLTKPGKYLAVHLVTADGKHATRRVHNLVMEAFVGPRPDRLEVRHLDGNPQNARLDNLAYGTSTENARDQLEHGTHHLGSRTACSRGHDYTPENTLVYRGTRYCRACKKVRYYRQRAA